MLFRLLILGLIFFLSAKLLGALLTTPKSDSEVRGRANKKPMDLSKEDVEDVDFKESNKKSNRS